MQIFEYPYVIITILVFLILIMGAVCLYFSLQCVRTAKESVVKSFSSSSKLENGFEKLSKERTMRSVTYITVSLDSMSRLYSQSKALRTLSQIRKALLDIFTCKLNGDIALYGDNSFVVLNQCDAKKLNDTIENCTSEINKILVNNEALNIVRVYFGYYTTNSTEVSFETAVNRAKQACTMAENKKISHCEWNNNNGKEFERKIKIENKIQNEIDNNRFFLEYQPFVDAKSGKIVGAEVLSRLNSEGDGILPPGAFLSAVNNVGLNEKFDYYIFEKNCKWVANNKEERENCFYTINFSRSTLCDKEFPEIITGIVEKYGVNYSSLAIEILEDKNLTRDEKAILSRNVLSLKEKGILILLDDFGRGFTAFTDLNEFSIDIVKIDKAITQNSGSETGFVLLKNMIQTAKDLGFKTVCEGIENEEQKLAAIKAGCDIMQGFYFYRPMPVLQLEQLMGNKS